MKSRDNTTRRQLNNSGSTLVTVIVAIAFVTVLASILLSTTVLDVHMKAMDRKNKDEFYYAEKGLNDIYTIIGQNVAILSAEAYEEALLVVGQENASVVNEKYKEKCVKKIYDYLVEVKTSLADSDPGNDKIKCVNNATTKVYWSGTGIICEGRAGAGIYSPVGAVRDVTKLRTVMKNVTVVSTSSEGYQSTVRADIVIDVPALDFAGENEELGNYAIIASEGIDIEGGAVAPNVVLGNVYAGVGKNASNKYDGGIKISDNSKAIMAGDYIVSKGNIEIGNGGKLTINSDKNAGIQSSVWFESMLVGRADANNEKPTVTDYNGATLETNSAVSTEANFFALNDLKLNGNGSTVKIAGNYYGYNSNITNTVENKNNAKASASNSSIIINGYSTTLDMSKIKNMIVNGKAYVQLDNGNEIPTAESLALKTNQQLYLFPANFLKCPNPAVIDSSTDPEQYFEDNCTKTADDEWWANDMIYDLNASGDYDSDSLKIDVNKVSESGGKAVVYAYIHFVESTESKKVAYKWNDSAHCYERKDGTTPGTGGTVSAETAYFNTILNCNDTAINPIKTNASGTIKTKADGSPDKYTLAPLPYTLHEQAFGSIKNGNYFDLKDCIVGDNQSKVNSQIFAKSALIEYKSSEGRKATKIDNTIALDDSSNYKDNLYHRFRHLCFYLDSLPNKPINGGTGSISDITISTEDDWWNSKYPMTNILSGIDYDSSSGEIKSSSHITGKTWTSADANREVDTGDFIIGDVVNITSGSGPHTGIVIANTINISGSEFRGLLIARKKVTINNSKISSDQGLIQRRISNEIKDLKDKDMNVKLNEDTSNGYLIKYLWNGEAGSPKYTEADINMDEQLDFNYNNYMHYENWQKGNR